MKNVTVDEFCNIKSLSNPSFSPNGKHFCFVMSKPDKEKNKYFSYICELKGKKVVKLTSGGKEGSFFFLDENNIVFAGNREEEKDDFGSKFYKLPLSGGEASLFLSFPINISSLTPLKSGDFLAVGTMIPGYEELYKGDKKLLEKYKKEQKENEDYETVDRNPWWWNGSTFTKSAYSALFFYDFKKKKLKLISKIGESVSGVKAKNGFVWYLASKVAPRLSMSDGTLYKTDLATFETTKIAENTDKFVMQAVVPADDFCYLLAHDNKYGLNTDVDFYKISCEDNKISLAAKYGEAIGTSVGTDVRHGGGRELKAVGNTLYFISTVFDQACLFKLDGGVVTKLTDNLGSVDSFDVCGDKLRLVALLDMRPQEIYDENLTRLTNFNPLKDKFVSIPEKFVFDRDGHELHGFVLKPKDYEKGKKYPVIFDIHGGPKTVYGEVYYHEMQYWASLGYFVIYTNPTGSDGRNSFMDIRGKYGAVDYDDLMAFCDKALELYPDMDKNNLFETGGSYGGFMTNWIIGHTDRFSACASQRSISNWFSFFGVSDIGVEFAVDQCAADPWKDTEKMWAESPLKYAPNVKTPTLFIHSFEDYRCPIDQGYQMFTALTNFGVETKMVLFKGENHELSRSGKPKHRIKRLNEITSWFEKHKK